MQSLVRSRIVALCCCLLTACASTPRQVSPSASPGTTTPVPAAGTATQTRTAGAATPVPGAVVAIRNMTVSRAAHSATLLPDGQVLIAGGFDASGHDLASAELFDPRARAFTPTRSMRVPRVAHSATLLPNGKVLIAGGLNKGEALASAELYDPATGQFSPTGALTTARHDHLAVLLGTGQVLIAGGVGTGYTFLATAELYDPGTGTFTATASLTAPREGATATLLQDGHVLVAGGHQGRHAAIVIYSSAEVYDPTTGMFTATGSMTTRRHKHDATLLPNGKVLISGGADERDDQGSYTSTETYDPQTGTFAPAASMHAARYKHAGTSVLLKTGKVLLLGGAGVTEIYDPAANAFSQVAQGVGATRLFAVTALLPDGAVLLAGGYGTNISASAQAWIFIP